MDTGKLKELFFRNFGKNCTEVSSLVPAGSARQYFRLRNGDITAVGAFNADVRENRAFLGFTKHFLNKGLPVPQIYAVASDEMHYLLEDLGDINLKDMTDPLRKSWSFPVEMIPWYKKALDLLIRFQTEGHEGLNYDLCFPRESFDKQSVLWDLNHFKYFFLKLTRIPFDENKLEDEFILLSEQIDLVDRNFFLFRDFQSRNIMIKNNNLYCIDYQGGRKGGLQYDVATLLFEARTNIDTSIRIQLLDYYLDNLLKIQPMITDRQKFMSAYYLFALVRQLQAMGAYGLRGWVQKKPLFLQSVPFAIKNLAYFLESATEQMSEFPELKRIMEAMLVNEKLNQPIPSPPEKLRVVITSFSYQKGIPDDMTGEGGGFVFDCRGIHNPGRFEEYKNLSGLDEEVERFFNEKTHMKEFLQDAFSLVDRNISVYTERGFKNLQVSFGCTGGQHRSVYAAQKLADHLEHNPDLTVLLEHRELKDLNLSK
ncbi:MAG: phosphotransferase [Bacteroidales bacterium]|nr:phosphotransferase [Bacteroidales bacterium]